MPIKICVKLILIGEILICFWQISIADGLIQVPAAIHISSTVSDGKFSIDEIIKIAKHNDIKIIILTDRDFMRWEYGLWPLRRIIKKTVDSNSVSTYGIERYLEKIKEVQRKNADLVIIPGVESAPFYYWQGSPFKKNFGIYNWHEHMLVIGLDKIEDYKNLPSVSNLHSLMLPWTFKDIYRFWPILILLAGILCLRKRKFNYKDLQNRSLGPHSHVWQIFGIFSIIFGLLFLFNNFPFRGFKYNQYNGDKGIGPYQNLIDYVRSRRGLTFWAHPEAENIGQRGKVNIETREHTNNLLKARDYTGFSIFYEGYKKVGLPGGLWDEILKQYCQGKRETPVWIIAGLSFDQAGDLKKEMQNIRNIFLLPRLNKLEVLKALKEGRMYVAKGLQSSNIVLNKFVVYDSISNNKGIVGDEVSVKGQSLIEICGVFYGKEQSKKVQIKLIRNGSIIENFEAISPFEISYTDEYSGKEGKIYYRLEIHCSGGILVTNPIFVKFRN